MMNDAEIYEELRNVLFNDSAIAGEAAGYAMGLVMLGTASEKALDEMLQYAHETQHEKIIRGLAIGISFLMFGKEEEADGLIETLLGDAVRLPSLLSRFCCEVADDASDDRMRFYDTEESTRSPWPTPERETTKRFENSFT